MRCAAWRPRWKYGTAGRLWYFVFGARVPTDGGECGGQPGNRGPALQQTPVGDDARIVPGMFAAAQTPAGGINPAPTNKFCVWGQTGTAATFRASVGRDALIPPDPAAAQGSPGGINPAPTNKFCVWGQTGTAAAFRAAVGRDAPISPHPAAAQGSPGGINPAPTNKICVSQGRPLPSGRP